MVTGFRAKIGDNTMHDNDALLSQKIDQLVTRFDTLEKRLEPIINAYDSVAFTRKFLVGVASILGAIAVIGGVVIACANWLRHG